jgi:hypothetical protein
VPRPSLKSRFYTTAMDYAGFIIIWSIVISMDLKELREEYFSEWVGNDLEFKGLDGYLYHGFLSDWLEDGSLVFNSLTTISFGDNGAQQELNTWGELFWLIINSASIAYIISTKPIESKRSKTARR